MGSLLSRSVEIQISNKTKNITLKNPRTYCDCGRCSVSPCGVLRPGSSDDSFFPGSSPFWGVAGILVYEAGPLSLAIHFSNPIDYNKFSMEVGLEMTTGDAHSDLAGTYARMAGGTYSSSRSDIAFERVVMGKGRGTARLSHGPIKVTATMSSETSSVLEVVVEDEGEEGEREKPQPGRHYQEPSPWRRVQERSPGKYTQERSPERHVQEPSPGRHYQES